MLLRHAWPPHALRLTRLARTEPRFARLHLSVLVAIAGAAVALGVPAASAASGLAPGTPDEGRLRAAPPSDISGRDFSGLRLPLDAVPGAIKFKARKAWAWAEESRPADPEGVDAPVHRLLLAGDVRITLGFYDFGADRAVVWIQKLPDSPTRYQVFVYLENAGMPTAAAATSVSADFLPVRAVIDANSEVDLNADLLTQGRPADPLIVQGEAALARSLRRMFEPEASPEGAAPGGPVPVTPGEAAQFTRTLPFTDDSQPIFASNGIITISPGNITVVSGKDENAVIVDGGVVVQYSELAGTKGFRVSGQRAVIFLSPGKLAELGRLRAGDVRGMYLEGDVVATDGRYTLRGPRIYYDVQKNKAVVVDAVFWTYEAQRRLPLYLRAATIKQESQDQFRAEHARLTTTAFFDPELSIGASTITIKRVPREPAAEQAASAPDAGLARIAALGPGTGGPAAGGGSGAGGVGVVGGAGGEQRTFVQAEDVTLRAGGLPFLYFPTFSGDPEQVPLRDVRIENSSGSGAAVKTTWSAYGLLGLDRPRNFDADVKLDAYFERGLGLGGRFAWNDIDRRGQIFGYILPDDNGTDIMPPGTEIDRDGETRGMLLGEHREEIDDSWTFVAENAYISDEAFVEAFFDNLAESRREFASRLNLTRREDESLFTMEVKGSVNDFIANEYLLQTPGYSVSRTPELTYSRVFDDPFGDVEPGLIRWTHEYRVGRLEMQFDEPTAEQHGFDTNSLAQRALGINANQTIAQRLRSQGYFEDGVWRADTRQEFDAPLEWGVLDINPYVVGRLTYWDNSFDQFSPDQDENTRYWGGIGNRVSTTIQRVDDSVESRLFDLHRMRHIIQPYLNVQQSGTNLQSHDLPIYDTEVEGIAEGGVADIGVAQTWQTQRGGAGRWHNVDVFKLDVAYTTVSQDADVTDPIGRFVSYRPEFSNYGNFWTFDGLWQVSDSLALTGRSVFNNDTGQQALSSLGAVVQHDPDFASFVQLFAVNSEDTSFIDFGQSYKLSSKYVIGWAASYETNDAGLQTINTEVSRSLPTAELGFGLSYDNITGETSFGFVFRPLGARGQGARLQGLGTGSSGSRSSAGGADF